ncbi:MAG: hypothetical protein H0U75_07960 [Legionella sp.]|nr:hypothetical protein [Legionella sp.]
MPWKKIDMGNPDLLNYTQTEKNTLVQDIVLIRESANSMRLNVYFRDEVRARALIVSLGVTSHCQVTLQYEGSYINFHSNTPNDYVNFLKVLLQEERHHLREILPTLCEHLTIPLRSIIPTIEDLKAMPLTEAISLALKDQEAGGFDLVYELLCYYKELSLSYTAKQLEELGVSNTVLMNLANSLSPINPHYRLEQDICF